MSFVPADRYLLEEEEEGFYKLRHDKNGPVVVREAVLVHTESPGT